MKRATDKQKFWEDSARERADEAERLNRVLDLVTIEISRHALFEENWCRMRKRRSDVEFVSLRAAQVLRDLESMLMKERSRETQKRLGKIVSQGKPEGET